MKKLILAAVLLSGMTFVACSNDDDNGRAACVNCTVTMMGQTQTSEICRSDFENDEQYEQAITSFEMLGSCN